MYNVIIHADTLHIPEAIAFTGCGMFTKLCVYTGNGSLNLQR